ncbi:restriction endonuclease subunit S [Ideonella dechloratans]|uniref:Restriction endonuclease subunit S n=1 Tax=Ideonella dechloratans TaxID=36863 RepID=A0A643F7K3_IDEDE|nr:restriction endonuclease subunit S [Ideonella dechloratans]KAB0575673.1 restriction endonuclease subunit S [Ideonella dechloratans]UFU11473.1 restriction endonuclease subunit S [Ideonella dechloratans]
MQSEVRQLRELCILIADCPHSTPVWTDSGYVVVRNQNIKSGRLDLSAPSFTDAEHFAHRVRRAKPTAGDIIFTREAPMGEVCMVPPGLECCVGQRQVLLRPNPKVVDGRFLLFALQSPQVQHEIGWNEGTGSTVSNVRIPVLEALRIPTPSLETQREIGEVLGVLDDRIDLLRQTNATLESIAQALFKSWFIDFDPVRAKAEGREPEGMDAATAALFPAEFEESALGLIPKGWCVGTFGDLAVLGKGSVNPMDFPTSTFEHYSLPAFDAGQLPILEEGASIKSNKTRVPRRAVLQSKLNPHIPRVWLIGDADKQAVCSTEFLPWMAREGASPALIYCTLRSPSFEAQVRTLVTGTSNSHQRVKPDQVASLAVVAAPPVVASAFAALVEPMLGKVLANRLKAQNLAELRDALLPRLISGKLRLPEAQEQLDDALA